MPACLGLPSVPQSPTRGSEAPGSGGLSLSLSLSIYIYIYICREREREREREIYMYTYTLPILCTNIVLLNILTGGLSCPASLTSVLCDEVTQSDLVCMSVLSACSDTSFVCCLYGYL